MTALAMLLMAAAAGLGLARWSRLPAIPMLLAVGMLASFTGLVDPPAIAGTAGPSPTPTLIIIELGLVFLVFASGIELNPERFQRQRRAVVWVGLIQFTVMGLVGLVAARWLGGTGMEPVYLGFAVSASSTLVVLGHLQATQRAFEPHGRMVIGVLLLQDALTLLVLVAVATSAQGPAGLAAGLGWASLMAATAWLIQKRLARRWLERCGADEEALLLGILSLLFLFLGAASFAGLPLVVGAFLAGYALSSFPVSGLVAGLLLSLVDFFRAVFFVAVGATVTLPDAGTVTTAVTLALLVLVITPPVVTAVAEWTGLNSRAAIESGLILAQTSEYSLVLGLVGLRLGHISPATFAAIALMAVLTMTVTPLLARDQIARLLLRWHPLRRRRSSPGPADHRDHVLILGLGSAGMWVLRPLQTAHLPFLVVDDDPQVIADLDRKGIPCLRGDGSEPETLQRAGAPHARLIVASMRRVADAETVLAAASGVPVLARVFEDHEAEHVRRLGGIPVSSAAAAADEFMKWFRRSVPPCPPHTAGSGFRS